MANELNDNSAALLSQHSGVVRPAYAQAGLMFADTTLGLPDFQMFVFDGVTDIEVFNITASVITFPNALPEAPNDGNIYGRQSLLWTQVSDVNHNHDLVYALIAHNHDAVYVNLTGDIMSGTLQALSLESTGNVFANGGRFLSDGTALILSHEGTNSNSIFFRPNGENSSVGEVVIRTNGQMEVGAAPTAGDDVTNKTYVDGLIAALVPALLTQASNEVVGVGATLTVTLATPYGATNDYVVAISQHLGGASSRDQVYATRISGSQFQLKNFGTSTANIGWITTEKTQ